MHTLLARTRTYSAPISYDITYAPSARAIHDRSTRMPVPEHTLSEPATEPRVSKLVVSCDRLPWKIVVRAGSARSTSPGFYVGRSAGPRSHVTVHDVLCAVHSCLLQPISRAEWDMLERGSKRETKVTRAYEERCIKTRGGWEEGVKRIDWLGQRTRFVGLQLSAEGGDAIAVFKKA